MRIEKKDFDKLSQLDRIEYMLKFEGTNNKYTYPYLSVFTALLYGAAYFMMIVLNMLFLIKFDSVIWSWNYLILVAWIFIIVIFLILIIDCARIIRKSRALNRLGEEYFKVDIKKNKK